MAQISITVPDGIAERVLNAVCKYHGYQDEIDGQPNPETKVQFTKRKIKETVKSWAVAGEGVVGRDTATTSAEAELNIED